jgi:hypothetical protein
LCSAGSATTPVSLAVRRSRTVALPKSPKLKVFSTIGIIRQYRITAPIVFEEFASFTRRVLELLDDQELTDLPRPKQPKIQAYNLHGNFAQVCTESGVSLRLLKFAQALRLHKICTRFHSRNFP